MSQSQSKAESNKDLVDTLGDFLRAYYDDRESGRAQIKELAQKYPNEQRSLEIDYDDIYRFSPNLADDVLDVRDAAKREEDDFVDEDDNVAEPIVDPEIFRKWIAVAKQQPNPPFESQSVKEQLRESFLEIRKLYDVRDSSPVPVTFRDLEGLVRIAEAAAKFELSDTITERHAQIATKMAGRSMQDVGKNEDDEYDADVVEVGQSKSQKDRKKTLKRSIDDLEDEYDSGVPRECVIEYIQEDCDRDYSADRLHADMDALLEAGEAIEPQTDHIRYLGRVA